MTAETQEQETRNPWTRWQFVLGATFLTVVFAVGGIVAALMWWESRTWERDTTVAACERPTSKDYQLTGAIPVHDWRTLGASPLPVTDFGPSREEGGAPVCYERSPQGAAMAAVHVATLASNGSTELVLEHMALDTQTTRDHLAATDQEAVPADPTRALAVRMADYSSEEATVAVVLETQSGPHVMDFTVVWEDGDWRWDTPTESLTADYLPSLSGYNTLEVTDG